MKTFDATRIIDIAGTLIPLSMLALIAMLCIRFIMRYTGLCIWHYTICIKPFFICDYARKRVMGRVIYRRKFAVFTINPDNGRGYPGEKKPMYQGYRGIQRGLLKDKT